MPKNLEVKATISSARKAYDTATSILASHIGILEQTDTYFNVPRGRLKFREIKNQPAELIFYERSENSLDRVSNFDIYPTTNPSQLKQILQQSLQTIAVVSKKRTLFIFQGARIHIDEVADLGCFLEFEVPIDDSLETARRLMDWLLISFDVQPHAHIVHSYLDIMLARRKS